MARWMPWVALIVASVLGSGCYYGHLARGQARLLWAREPVDRVLADPETSDELRHKLSLVSRARDTARDLGLEVGGQYTSFVPWPDDRMVTTVVATPAGSVDPAPFWFPIVGHVPYKGYFDRDRARAEADKLEKKGFDTCLFAIDAYSTLGFMNDPVTEPQLARSDGALVELIVHELVHATFYVKSQPDFNEGAAQFVGQEAAVRFFEDDPEAVLRERNRIRERRLLADTLLGFREELRAFHEGAAARTEAAGASGAMVTEIATAERAAMETSMRARIAELPLVHRDAARLAEGIRLNEACLALQGTYGADLVLHAARLDAIDGDLTAYVTVLRNAADEDDPREAVFGEASSQTETDADESSSNRNSSPD